LQSVIERDQIFAALFGNQTIAIRLFVMSLQRENEGRLARIAAFSRP
jgi:hypothetical protein